MYNLVQGSLTYFSSETVLVFLQGQINTSLDQSFIGEIFDNFITFVFNINLKDLNTYFKMFGV
ncbi:MAG: hypothetical protein PHX62_02280 [Bacilli bacterium]|nr:hypothetical protein [Bacilli bacterium]